MRSTTSRRCASAAACRSRPANASPGGRRFLPWFERRALDIVQPDVTKVGGISEQIQIARIANAFGVKYIGHGWNTAIGLAADLQLASAVPTADLVEYIGGSPYVDEITRRRLEPGRATA